MHFLDTNVIVDLIRGNCPALKNHFMRMRLSEMAIPAIVIAELEYGSWHSGDYKRRSAEAMDVIRNFEIYPFGLQEAKAYGLIRQELSAKGIVIGPNDLFIAATALANDGVLITHNTKEFSRVPHLAIEDWTILPH